MQYRDQGRQACTHTQVMRAAIACAGTCNNKRTYMHMQLHISLHAAVIVSRCGMAIIYMSALTNDDSSR
jgi:uncharacterized radical SAM superfamily Fe-S cluster-containing enzyme